MEKFEETGADSTTSPLASNQRGNIIFLVKTRRYSAVKRMEARSRSQVVASKGTHTAARRQGRVSLAGDGAKWRITNWRQVAAAMANWA